MQKNHSSMAIRETVVLSIVAVVLACFQKYEYIAFSTLLSPILLFKCPKSIQAGIDEFDNYLESLSSPIILSIKGILASILSMFLAFLLSYFVFNIYLKILPRISDSYTITIFGFIINIIIGWLIGIFCFSIFTAFNLGSIIFSANHKKYTFFMVISVIFSFGYFYFLKTPPAIYMIAQSIGLIITLSAILIRDDDE